MKELKLTVAGVVVSALLLGYYAHTYTYPLVKDAVQARLYKELPELPDFQLMVPEEVDTKVLSQLALASRRMKKSVSAAPEKPPSYQLVFTYIGKRKKYAIINGRLVTEGERISPYERVVKISEGRVLLSGRWGKRWLTLVD